MPGWSENVGCVPTKYNTREAFNNQNTRRQNSVKNKLSQLVK